MSALPGTGRNALCCRHPREGGDPFFEQLEWIGDGGANGFPPSRE